METKRKNSAIGITGFIFGIISILLSCIMIGGFTGLIGVVLCIIALVEKNTKNGLAITGVILNTLAIVIVIITLIGSFSEKEEDAESLSAQAVSSSESVPTEEQVTDDRYATIEKFNQIKTGMTYQEVVEIMGSEGTVMSESGIDGIITTIYCWESKFGIANMNVTVTNGEVMAKAQIGLD